MKKRSLILTLPLALFLCSEANAQLDGVLVKDATSTTPASAFKRFQIDAATGVTPASTTLQGLLLTNGTGTGVGASDGLLIGVGNYSVLSTNTDGSANVGPVSANSISILNRETSALAFGTGTQQNAMVMKSNGAMAIGSPASFSTLSTTTAIASSNSTSTITNAKMPALAMGANGARLTVKGATSEIGLYVQGAATTAAYLLSTGAGPSLVAQNLGNGNAARFISSGGTTVTIQNKSHSNGVGVSYSSVTGAANNIGFSATMSGTGNRGFFAYIPSGDVNCVPITGQKGVSSTTKGVSYGNRNNTFAGDISIGSLPTPTPPSTGAANTAVIGHLFADNISDAYSFGVYGDASLDGVSSTSMNPAGTRIGGVLGRVYNGDIGGTKVFSYGMLGYIESTGASWGGYFMNNATGSDNGRLAQKKESQMGIGAFAGITGAVIRGGYYGMNLKGERFAMYADGKTFTNDVIAQLTNTTGNTRIATYVPTSTTVDVSSRGVAQLANGTTFVNFDENYAQLVEEGTIMVTVTPNAASAGVYVTEVTSKGFRVVENGNGTSNVKVTWRADAVKKGMNTVALPEEVLANDYDANMRKVMVSDIEAGEKKGMSIINGKLVFEKAPVPAPAPVSEEPTTKGE